MSRGVETLGGFAVRWRWAGKEEEGSYSNLLPGGGLLRGATKVLCVHWEEKVLLVCW